jgi:Txe/YoeB family toxin of Txe-Axe toxin-antitoxin module
MSNYWYGPSTSMSDEDFWNGPSISDEDFLHSYIRDVYNCIYKEPMENIHECLKIFESTRNEYNRRIDARNRMVPCASDRDEIYTRLKGIYLNQCHRYILPKSIVFAVNETLFAAHDVILVNKKYLYTDYSKFKQVWFAMHEQYARGNLNFYHSHLLKGADLSNDPEYWHQLRDLIKIYGR